MKTLVVVCLGALVFSSVELGAAANHPNAFAPADRVGEPGERSFFLFSTSAGNYIVRHDGMGEFTSPKGMRRVFTLKLGVKGRIEQIYFLEHQGDVFLFYEVQDVAFLVRMEQTKRKIRWFTPVASAGVPVMEGDAVVVNMTKISIVDGKIVRD